MVSNTGSNGIVSASTTYDTSGNYDAFRAFDRSFNTFWSTIHSDTSKYIQYEFNTPVSISSIGYTARRDTTNQIPQTVDVYVKNGSNWILHSTFNPIFNFGNNVHVLENVATNIDGIRLVYAADATVVSQLNNSLGGLTFGTDGEGNYGYFGDDDVLVPFKSGAEILVSKSASQYSTVTLFTATRRIEKPYVVVHGYTAFSIIVNGVEMPLIEFSGQPLSDSLGYKQVNATIEKGDVVSWNPRNGGTNYIIMVG